jgi:hypothetical protein
MYKEVAMSDMIQVHAFLPRQLKRRAFGALALREQRFSQWLRDALEAWLREVEHPQDSDADRPQDHPDP